MVTRYDPRASAATASSGNVATVAVPGSEPLEFGVARDGQVAGGS